MIITIARWIIGTIVGIVVGATVNMFIVVNSARFLPPPAGVDVSQVESIRAHIGEYSPLQLAGPWLAHALGTLVGAILATFISGAKGPIPALLVGACFLAGGTMMIIMIPETPWWFTLADLGGAYIPMGLLGWRVVRPKR